MFEAKLDGYRALYLRDWEGRPGLYMRNGYPIEGVSHILHELSAWERHAGEAMFLDGEFIVDAADTFAATKAWCDRDWKQGGNAGAFHVFDGFPHAQWMDGGTGTPLWQRKARLTEIVASVAADEVHQWEWRPGSRGQGEGDNPVRLVPYADAWTYSCVVEQVTALWDAGLEGAVIKDPFAPYVRARSNAWQKIGRPWQVKLKWKA